MAHIALLRLLPRYAFFWFIATFVVILPLTACGAISGRTDPPLDTACGESTTLSSNVDHRYLSSITMQNETTGWGQNYVQKGGTSSGVPTAEQTILHTTDGGCHWKIVKSWKYSMEPSPDFYPFFFSASQALVYVNGVFSLTRDSGVTWSSVTLPIATGQKLFPQQVFFLDDQHGWISASVTSGQSVQNDALLHTTDGGLSWTQMHTTFPAGLSDGRIEHLYFLNETTGWITGMSLPNDKQPQERHWIYITHDGGLSWHEQHLPDSQGYRTSSLLELGSPRFFSAKDGILPAASTHYAPTGTCAFITHDGGQSWQSMPFFAIEDYSRKVVNPDNLPGPQITVYILVPVPYFTSLTTGWAGTSYVYRTTDGGRSWHYFDQQLVHYSDPGLRFVTDHVALALASTGSATDFQSPTELYKTTNGGKTWTTLRYTVS